MRRGERVLTINDVAQRAGLGTATVSRVLNDQPRVSRKTRAKVLAIIEELGFKPNEAARSLRGRTERIIGVIVPDLSDMVYLNCIKEIHSVARAGRYRVLVACGGDDPHAERQEIRWMKERGASGVLIVPCDRAISTELPPDEFEIPVVSLLRPLEGIKADVVLMEQSECTVAMVHHLIANGSRQIVCLRDENAESAVKERVAAYLRMMDTAGLTTNVVDCKSTLKNVKEAILRIERQRVACDALLCLDGRSTLHAARVLRERAAELRPKIAVAGFDECGVVAALFPDAVTVSHSTAALATAAVKRLIKLMRHPDVAAREVRRIVIPRCVNPARRIGCAEA